MFIYSLRAGTIRLVGVMCVALTVLITLIAFVPTYSVLSPDEAANAQAGISYDKVKSAEDAASFLSQYGWEVVKEPIETQKVTVPEEFDKVFLVYNELQKEQGLNLSRYKGKEVTRYTFSVSNYPEYKGTVWANVLVYRNRVVGGDICSADVTGFVHGFEKRVQDS